MKRAFTLGLLVALVVLSGVANADLVGIDALDENKPLYSETFTGYKTGQEIVGQKYTSQSGLSSVSWSGDNGKAKVNTTGLYYEGYQSADQTGGKITVNGQRIYVATNSSLLESAGLLGSDGYYGGADVNGTLYIGFLTQSDSYPAWGAGLQLYKDSTEQLGIGRYNNAGNFSIFGNTAGSNILNTNNATLADKKTHLIIAKIDYNANANDNITFYFDPVLTRPEAEQPAAAITTFSGNAAFNTLQIRNGGSAWNVDEIRLGTTWNSLLQSNVNPSESTFKTTPIIKESFSGYTEGTINGQAYQGTGEEPNGTWNTTNNDATIVTGESLQYDGWDSSPGYLIVNNSQAEMTLDQDVLLAARLVDANGNYGGESVQGTVYFGFLLNGNDARSWSGGAELFLNNAEVLGLGQRSGAWAYSGFVRKPSSQNFNLNSANHEPNVSYEYVDSEDHLIIARIDFKPDATDILTVYFDPDLTLSEAEQSDALKTVITGYDLTFDEIRFRNGATWYYDEFRMALTWEGVINHIVPEPSTWALLLLGAAGLLYVRKRTRK